MKKTFLTFIVTLLLLISCSQEKSIRLKPLLPTDTILAFGDSLTFGVGTVPSSSYPSVLERMIGMSVINAGIPGEETLQGVERIQQELEAHSPSLVIVCLGGNDILRKRALGQAKKNLAEIIRKIHAYGAQVVLIGVPTIGLNLNVPPLFKELGQEFNIPVDIIILPELLKSTQYKSDYIHLNSAGYALLASKIAGLLKTYGAIKQ